MGRSPYIRALRARVGHDLLVLPSVSALVLDDHGRVLLARHAETGRWVFPGGGVDPLELPADAVVRETFEETGLLVRPLRIVGVYGGEGCHIRYRNGDEVAYVVTAFACEVLGGEPAADGGEILELRFVAPAEVAALDVAPWVTGLVDDLLAAGDGAAFAAPGWRPG